MTASVELTMSNYFISFKNEIMYWKKIIYSLYMDISKTLPFCQREQKYLPPMHILCAVFIWAKSWEKKCYSDSSPPYRWEKPKVASWAISI